jgi:hypothetical protein
MEHFKRTSERRKDRNKKKKEKRRHYFWVKDRNKIVIMTLKSSKENSMSIMKTSLDKFLN